MKKREKKPENGKVTVVIPNYFGMKFLQDCLQSLQKQASGTPEYKVLVVDNSSQDGSVNPNFVVKPCRCFQPVEAQLSAAGRFHRGNLFPRAMSQVPCLHEHMANAARGAKRQWRLFSTDRSGA